MVSQLLQTGGCYDLVLLHLMGRLQRAPISQVFVEFEREFGERIPSEHLQALPGGQVRWQNYTQWARQRLVDAGLMGSGGRGTWTITPAGQQWIAEHPDGGEEALKELIQSSKANKASARTNPKTAQRRERPRPSQQAAVAGPGLSYEDLKHIKQYVPPDEFQARFGERWEMLLAEERARSQTVVSDQELGRRARQILREVHAFLNGTSGATSSERAYDWLQFCYALGLYREAAALLNYIVQDDLPAWAYERACKVAEACRARIGA